MNPKPRLVFHAGFRIDTWNSIEERYLWLCNPLKQYFDVYWLVPPTGSRYSRSREENRNKEPIFVTRLKENGANIIVADITKWNFFKNYSIIKKIYRDNKIDAVYTHFSPLGYYLEFFGRFMGVKVIRGEHNFTFNKYRKYKLMKWIFWKLTTDYYIAVSKSVLQHLESVKLADSRNACFVYNGFDISKVPISNKERNRRILISQYSLSENATILVCCAKIKPDKGQHVLVEMLQGLDENVSLFLVGDVIDGAYRRQLEHLAQALEVKNRVFFTGHRFDIYSIIDAAAVTYLPSLFEGLSNVVIESFFMSTPVIASDIPPSREIIDHGVNGFCVKNQNVEQFRHYTRMFLNNPELINQFGESGRKKVGSLFDKNKFIHESIMALQNALKKNGK